MPNISLALYILLNLLGTVVYVLIGFATGAVLTLIYGKETFCDLREDQKTSVVLAGIFFPIAWIVGILYWAVNIVILPFTAATKEDLKELEASLAEKIEAKKLVVQKPKESKPKFKTEDIITGNPGNPDGYKHLYEGCKCRVLSIDDKGSMNVILLDHKDKEAHKKQIGKVFKAPARNFVLLKSKRKK